jgi:Lon protease-like protein
MTTTAHTTAQIVASERLDHLPIFPLPNAVLIPQGHLPLHVFEPRYRQLVSDCMDGDRMMAIALLERDETSHLDRPPLHAVAGLGYIDIHQELPDGRSLIVLRGVMRVEIRGERETDTPYRVVRAGRLRDAPPSSGGAATDAMTVVRQLVRQLGGLIPDDAGRTLVEICSRERDPGKLADLVGSAVVLEPSERQAFLEQVDVMRRLECATGALASVIDHLREGGDHVLN